MISMRTNLNATHKMMKSRELCALDFVATLYEGVFLHQLDDTPVHKAMSILFVEFGGEVCFHWNYCNSQSHLLEREGHILLLYSAIGLI